MLFVATAAGILLAPRKWAALPFLVGCCYVTVGQGLDLGGLNLPIIRMLVVMGIIRIIVRGEGMSGGVNGLDKVVIGWTVWVFFASLFHEWVPGSGPVYMAGSLLNTAGFYFMIRSFCDDPEDLADLLAALCFVLAPVGIFMLIEQVYHWNVFSVFGGVLDSPALRNGRFRAQGPFNHAILAGTVGAACFPFAIAIWKRHRTAAIVGMVSCILMIVSCASSGPIISLILSGIALFLWKYRPLVRLLRMAAVPSYVLLAMLMERPPYFLISKIDLTGASTGWHRSYLIQQTIEHFDEWWLFGTDRTIHWMPNQGHISEIHTDITNQYIAYGVSGGFLSMALIIIILWLSFRTVGRLVDSPGLEEGQGFIFWCIGASLFSLAASGISVSFFGQAMFFFWLPIAAIASFYAPASRDLAYDADDSDTSVGMERSPRVDVASWRSF